MYFDVTVLLQYWPRLLEGLLNTVWIVAVAFAGGACIGLLVALVSLSRRRPVALLGRVYVNAFRNMPEMVLIFWAYFCLPELLGLNLSALLTGTLALALSAGANLGEVFRAGVQAVPRGQSEAALALGLGPVARWMRVILPQALRRMTAPLVNYFTELLKHSTLLSAIGVTEVAHAAFTLGSQTFRYLEFFTAIGVAFFVIIFPLSLLSRRMLRRGVSRLGA